MPPRSRPPATSKPHGSRCPGGGQAAARAVTELSERLGSAEQTKTAAADTIRATQEQAARDVQVARLALP
ncbi:hypothetical protein ACIBP6_45365, partial [Nonomuraea terrae]|uniref:hypothetical protein n=1 Tax=Nonomuraea terrae TaxID=2530383 RepID=UPI0037A5427D